MSDRASARGRRWTRQVLPWCVASLLMLALSASAERTLVVGSKNFTESYLLGEIMAQRLEGKGWRVTRRFGLGGTLICYEALVSGEIDLYVEYTGTITEVILAGDVAPERDALKAPLAEIGLLPLPELGFDNTYAVVLTADRAAELGVTRLSQLADLPTLRVAFSHEFLRRQDGWPGLRERYGLRQRPVGIEHGLSYQALLRGSIDATDAYSTDGDLERYGLVTLQDDRAFFPRYAALPLARDDLPEGARAVLADLAGRIDDERMRRLNAEVVVGQRSFAAVAADFLAAEGFDASPVASATWRDELLANTVRHLQLTLIALGLAVLLGLPLGVLVHRSRRASRVVLYAAGLLQTIPSIALLALMIPVFGIGVLPAIAALLLYSLLPILRATVTALVSVDPLLRRVAVGMGLTDFQQVRHLLLPLALPNVLAGVRTAAVISIGTATLAAFVGAGGLGQPIVTGLALNDPGLILQGAIPAALLAVATELCFEALERWLIPAHMRSASSV
ncbi:MAG: ABC transporter permease subunit [Gammaproteobacteria bacterium]|nr:ABC transporter permease subunit [Gammaproteobacteria bacterium]